MQAADATAARHVVHQYLRPQICRDGRVVYRLKDGGVVSDEAKQVRVSQLTTSAAFLALSLASDRFGDRALTVRGSDEFRAQVAMLAGSKGLHGAVRRWCDGTTATIGAGRASHTAGSRARRIMLPAQVSPDGCPVAGGSPAHGRLVAVAERRRYMR